MYQFIGVINDEKVHGLESILSYMNETSFCKDDPAMNEHRYRVTKQLYNEEAHNIYNIDKTKTYNITNNRCTDEHDYNKKQKVNNNIANHVSKQKHYI